MEVLTLCSKCFTKSLTLRVFMALNLGLLATVPAFCDMAPGAEVQMAHWRAGIREALFVPEQLPELGATVHGRFEPEAGIIAERVTYNTLYGMRVPAILYRPARAAKKAPALIVVNGHGGDKYSWYAGYAGVLYARAGAVVLTYDPMGEGERNPARKSGTRAHDNLRPQSHELGRHVAGQMIADLRQAISYLESRPEVDATRIGAVGYSMGTVVVGFTGAIEPRLAATVLAGGGNWDGPGEYWDLVKPLCSGFPFQSLRPLGDVPAILYALRAQYGPMLVYNGLADQVVNIPETGPPFMEDLRKRTAALLGSTEPPFDLLFDAGVSHRPFFLTRPAALWLDRQLDFPQWSQDDISRMGTSHISEWAKQNSVELDPNYAVESREGGTQALGEHLPGLSREQLSVLSGAQWESEKSRLTIDVWQRKVSELIQAPSHPVELVRDAQAKATIVVSPDAATWEQKAASELQSYIEKSTGVTLPISADAAGCKILVGVAASPEARILSGLYMTTVEKKIATLADDGFMIAATADGKLILAGSGEYGTLFAVYAFLERYLGVRWLWPGDSGEVVPRHKDIHFDVFRRIEQPAFVWRDLGPRGALWGPFDKWQAERHLGVSRKHQEIQAEWELRNRFGGVRIYGGHAFGQILPPTRYGKTHPEYFALVNGKRDADAAGFDGKHGHQPCTTNPDVLRITVDYVRAFFDQYPEYDAFSISLNDDGTLCQCDRCSALDDALEGDVEVVPETGLAARRRMVTDRVITFANAVAEQVVATHPGKKVILFAYQQCQRPPRRVKPHPALIIHYTLETGQHVNREFAERDFAMAAGWSASGAQNLAIYDYFIRGGWPDLPRIFPKEVAESVRRLHEMNYRYFQTQHGDGYAINGLNYYVLGRLLWDPSLDVEALRQDYLEAGFGAAATPVARYLQRLEKRYADSGGRYLFDHARLSEYRKLVETYPIESLRECRSDLDEARRVAVGDGVARVEFLKQGLRYAELTVEAVAKTIALLDAGWKLDRNVVPPASADMAAFTQARNAWEERDQYVESLKDGFVVAYMWIKYNDRQRGWNPRRAMDKFLEVGAAAAGGG